MAKGVKCIIKKKGKKCRTKHNNKKKDVEKKMWICRFSIIRITAYSSM